MPTYPAYPVRREGSSQDDLDDLVIDEWPKGNARGRSYFTINGCRWVLVHGKITDAQRATHRTFYSTNKLSLFDFVSPWDGLTYTNVGFVGRPIYTRLAEDWEITAMLRSFN